MRSTNENGEVKGVRVVDQLKWVRKVKEDNCLAPEPVLSPPCPYYRGCRQHLRTCISGMLTTSMKKEKMPLLTIRRRMRGWVLYFAF